MAYQFIRTEISDHVLLVTINRPQVMNALHPPANQELGEVFDQFKNDAALWVAIITGTGDKAFCAGRDLKSTAAGENYDHIHPSGGAGGITNRHDLFKPIIAAVNGVALGGGCEIALACDIIVAADHARFGLPEPRVGRFAGAGGIHRLPRQVPLKVAMGMVLTGRHVTAQEAKSFGLVNEVVPLPQLLPTARRWAQDIMECAPLGVQISKQAQISLHLSLKEAMATELPLNKAVVESEDRVEGPRAFVQKRKPIWKGR